MTRIIVALVVCAALTGCLTEPRPCTKIGDMPVPTDTGAVHITFWQCPRGSTVK